MQAEAAPVTGRRAEDGGGGFAGDEAVGIVWDRSRRSAR